MSKIISPALFAEHFRRAWLGARGTLRYDRRDQNDLIQLPHRIGLAVSGGADSMCLAYLCQKLEQLGVHGSISVTAFVVDHKARQESNHEAKTVAGWLRDMGLETEILELDWSPSLDSREKPKESDSKAAMPTAFETHARRLRFQALGKACRDREIETLLLGHHQDDTVETTIWRLSTGMRGAGLAGIQGIARIPECRGLFGVSESGSSIVLPGRQRNTSVEAQVRVNNKASATVTFVPNSNNQKHKSPKGKPVAPTEVSVATGGVYLCRPFLGFPKKNILETCRTFKIPYVSDPTNFDPTLTPRNAVRSLISSGTLPRALQSPSILSLIKASDDILQTSNQLADQLLSSKCRIIDLNLKSGMLVAQFLELPPFLDSFRSNLSDNRAREIECLALRRITELISPCPANQFSLRSFEPFVSRVFSPNDDQPRHAFTLGGVKFMPLDVTPSPPSSSPATTQGLNPGKGSLWLLSRQPFFKNRAPVTHLELPAHSSTPTRTKPSRTEWTLWDDRFWFRVSLFLNKTKMDDPTKPVSFVLRPLRTDDLQQVCKNVGPGKAASIGGHLQKQLLGDAPGDVRYTVPVLAVKFPSKSGSKSGEEEAEHLLALPTFDLLLSGRKPPADRLNEMGFQHDSTIWTVRWEWMYKEIDTETVRLMGGPLKAEDKIVG
ncbi:hypothetical protein N7509_002793 [Penicillium cosmopolitanum]|uniref:tRNA(Ile)-lysidine synthetase n=1 Tax=Penicillium cosmopolitanum TaxID=1131564 RepID=A0A9W9WA36_9EURO|nr:uncharacterized protein N7509_002793 [Penicillium cosmopolitanum]KAJ5408910.1 hypothetical protein N7509_002793 [Penicillium cosmopolitanum]